MVALPIRSFRMNLLAYLRRAGEGEVLTITRHRRPIAEVHPVGTWEREMAAAAEALQCAAEGVRLAIMLREVEAELARAIKDRDG